MDHRAMDRRTYFKQKLSFIKHAMIVFGLPAAFVAWLILGRYGTPLFQVFIIIFTLGCGYLWSLAIWHFFIHASHPKDEDMPKDGEEK